MRRKAEKLTVKERKERKFERMGGHPVKKFGNKAII
jgi:hypothetical protein